MNPDATIIQYRLALAFQYYYSEIETALTKFRNYQRFREIVCSFPVNKYTLAIDYMMLLYKDVTAPYAIPTTLEDLKEKFDYNTIKKCFSCQSVNLDDLVTILNLEELVETNIDNLG